MIWGLTSSQNVLSSMLELTFPKSLRKRVPPYLEHTPSFLDGGDTTTPQSTTLEACSPSTCSQVISQVKGKILRSHYWVLIWTLRIWYTDFHCHGRFTWSWSKGRTWTSGEIWQPSLRMRSANWENWRPQEKEQVHNFPVKMSTKQFRLGFSLHITFYKLKSYNILIYCTQVTAARALTPLWVQMYRWCSKERHTANCRRYTSTLSRRFRLEDPISTLVTGRVCCSKLECTWPEQGMNAGSRFGWVAHT